VMGLEVDGEVLEGQGVAPDIAVQRPLPYSNASDPVLDVALAELAKRASSNLPAAGALAK
jgi:C-terminal processing protease CtpA/Prc